MSPPIMQADRLPQMPLSFFIYADPSSLLPFGMCLEFFRKKPFTKHLFSDTIAFGFVNRLRGLPITPTARCVGWRLP